MKDKYYFLLYFPILYIFPPFHEMVHVLIGWAFRVKVLKVEWALTTYQNKGSSLHWFIQTKVWDAYLLMQILSLTCIILFVLYLLRYRFHLRLNWDKIRGIENATQ